eukprot:653606-Pelagomonas_calceolata.AAC.1
MTAMARATCFLMNHEPFVVHHGHLECWHTGAHPSAKGLGGGNPKTTFHIEAHEQDSVLGGPDAMV